MRQPALSQAVFPAARFFRRKAGTSVAVASSIASARLMAAEDAPSHLYRSKQASSAFGQMALRSLLHQDPTSGQREIMPGAAPSFGPPRPISRLGRLGRGEAGGPCSHRYRQSIPPPATSRHLLAGTHQLVTHLVGVRVVRVRVRVG